jgi:4-amino-4-deoxy-L-arabinose transferase-like glycosyltransferase
MIPALFVTVVFSLSFVFCLMVSMKYRWLLLPIMLGFAFRCLLMILDYYGVFTPPGATGDAVVFTRRAYEWSLLDWDRLFSTFNYSASYVYSTIGAVFFKLLGYNNFVLPSLNFFAGMLGIFLTGIMAYRLWGRKPAVISAYIMALFPFAAFNSVIALREEFSIVVFLLGVYFFLNWVSGKGTIWIFAAFCMFSVAVMIHPGWLGGMVGIALYLGYFAFRTLILSIKGGATTIQVASKFFSAVALFAVAMLIVVGSGGITLAKGITIGGDNEEEGVEDLIESRFQREARGGSAYPGFIAQGNPYTQPWLIPMRIVYFTFSPFPWDLRSPRQIMGILASAMYMFLAWRLYKGWSRVKRKEECIALMFMAGALIFVFAIGVTNIGTAIRHRTKFLAICTLLAASSFDRFTIRLRRL